MIFQKLQRIFCQISPGEFYQLDLEMSFVEQEDVFDVVEKLLTNTFKKFSKKN